MLRIILAICSLLFVLACNSAQNIKSGNEKLPLTQKDCPDKGIVLPKIKLKSDSLISYALYVPLNYDTAQSWPVIYFFDASGRGKFAVQQYTKLADKYGFVLIGSNNNRNGLSQQQHDEFSRKIITEASQRYSLNMQRQYTSGFSGGARVAVSVALYQSEIAGVIACAAGFPEIRQGFRQDFSFIGVVGNRDFNHNEMKQLDKSLEQTSITHHLIVFDGKHQWPPFEIFEDVLMTLEMNAMQKALLPKIDTLINYFAKFNRQRINDLQQIKDFGAEVILLEKMKKFGSGLMAIEEVEKKIQTIKNSNEFKNWENQELKNQTIENALQQEMLEAFQRKDLIWWKTKIAELRQLAKGTTPKSLIYSRILSLTGMLAHINYDKAMKQSAAEQAYNFLQIKAIALPEEPISNFLFSSYFALNGDLKKACHYLELADSQGFDEIDRLTTDAGVLKLKDKPEYQKLLKRLIHL
jgi:hypothetical protein